MKSFIFAVILFITVILIVAINSFFVCDVCNKIYNLTKKVELGQDVTKSLEEISSIWRKSHKILDLSIETHEIERMSEMIVSARTAGKEGKDDELQKYCELIRELCEEFMRHEKISVNSLF